MLDKDKLICPYCKGENGYIIGKIIHTKELKQTTAYNEPTNYVDILNIFVLKGKDDKYASLMLENANGVRCTDIRYCPFCGRKLYKSNLKREVE